MGILDANMNEKGKEYQYVSVSERRRDYGILPVVASNFLSSINVKLVEKWNAKTTEQEPELASIFGLVNGLEVSALSISRILARSLVMINEVKVLYEQNQEQLTKGSFQKIEKGTEIAADFGSLLLHSRALLDRLAWFLSGKCQGIRGKKQATSINDLLKKPDKYVVLDEKNNEILKFINNAEGLRSIIVDNVEDNIKALRSYLAHQESSFEMVRRSFTFVVYHDGTFLAFDGMLKQYPICITTICLAQNITYVILNTIACLLEMNDRLEYTDCELDIKLPFISCDDYQSDDGVHDITLCKMEPTGFKQFTVKCDDSISEALLKLEDW